MLSCPNKEAGGRPSTPADARGRKGKRGDVFCLGGSCRCSARCAQATNLPGIIYGAGGKVDQANRLAPTQSSTEHNTRSSPPAVIFSRRPSRSDPLSAFGEGRNLKTPAAEAAFSFPTRSGRDPENQPRPGAEVDELMGGVVCEYYKNEKLEFRLSGAGLEFGRCCITSLRFHVFNETSRFKYARAPLHPLVRGKLQFLW